MISDRITAFCGENYNTNYQGAARKGRDNDFAMLNSSNLKMNIQDIGCIGCATHILHNPASADILPIDVAATVNKIFQYFHIYMVQKG
jgi:hypothetical protein